MLRLQELSDRASKRASEFWPLAILVSLAFTSKKEKKTLIHNKWKYFLKSVQTAESRGQKFNLCCLPFVVNIMLKLSNKLQRDTGEQIRPFEA